MIECFRSIFRALLNLKKKIHNPKQNKLLHFLSKQDHGSTNQLIEVISSTKTIIVWRKYSEKWNIFLISREMVIGILHLHCFFKNRFQNGFHYRCLTLNFLNSKHLTVFSLTHSFFLSLSLSCNGFSHIL